MNISLQNNELSIGKIGIFGFCFFAPISIALSQIFIGISIIGWIIQSFNTKKITWYKTPLDYAILFYIITQLIAVFRSDDIAAAFSGWIDTDWFILFFYAVVNIISKEKDLNIILKLMLISAFVSSIYGIWQYFAGWDLIRDRPLELYNINFFRVGGFMGLPLTYGGIQLIYLCLIFPFYFSIKKNKLRLYILIICCLLFISIIFSFARSIWLGFGIVVTLTFFLINKKYFLITLLSVALIIFITTIVFPENVFQKTFLTIFDVSESAPYSNQVRIHLWKSAINMIKDFPVLGVGISDFSKYFELYKIPFDYHGLNDPHNDLLHITAASGIVGSLAFLVLWITLLVNKFKKIIKFKTPDTFWESAIFGGFLTVLALLIAGIAQSYYRDAEVAQLWWFAAAFGITGLLNSNRTKF